MNAPENRDTDFSWREFIYSHNSELLGAYGNFINRTLKFIEKSYDGKLPEHEVNKEVKYSTEKLYIEVGRFIEDGHFKLALESIFGYVRSANKYFDEQKPWIQIKGDLPASGETISTCVYIIGNASQLLSPFLPISSEEVRKILSIKEFTWTPIMITKCQLPQIEPLFERIDTKTIEEEYDYLVNHSKLM